MRELTASDPENHHQTIRARTAWSPFPYRKSARSRASFPVQMEMFRWRSVCRRSNSVRATIRKRVETSIRLDGIDLPSNPKALAGRTCDFPVNPEDGYIDGSIYFFAAHHPVGRDAHRLSETSNNSRLPVKLSTNWLLEFENSGFKNFQTDIETEIAL